MYCLDSEIKFNAKRLNILPSSSSSLIDFYLNSWSQWCLSDKKAETPSSSYLSSTLMLTKILPDPSLRKCCAFEGDTDFVYESIYYFCSKKYSFKCEWEADYFLINLYRKNSKKGSIVLHSFEKNKKTSAFSII